MWDRTVKPLRRFFVDDRGNIALIFGLASMMIFTSMGAGLDLSRAYLARQKMSQVARLACQFASRPQIVDTSTASYSGTGGGSTYISLVNNFITTTWQSQNVNVTQSSASPFSYVQGSAAAVSLAASVPTTFMAIAGFTQMPISVTMQCYVTPAKVQQRIPDPTSQYVLNESFEAGGTPGGYNFYQPNGSAGTQPTPTSYTSATGYTGAGGTQWHIVGYCVEQDSAGVIKSSVANGNYSIELDCDNGSGNAGNSSISTMVYLAAGSYELRYNYASRVTFYDYDPAYVCASTASDLSWANSTNAFGWFGPRTNQINAYLDLNDASTNAPPTHLTIDKTQSLSGSNLIDMCVYSLNWVERSVAISVTTPGYYWLSFAADGANDSYGGQLDNVRLCQFSCPGTVQDNFPAAWISSSLLFEDTFESPIYTQDPYTTSKHAKGGNLAKSYGTTGNSASGWPEQAALGWATVPYNEVVYWMQGASQGNQYVSLQGWNGFSNSSDPINRSLSRPFLLDPGYYNVSYKYVSLMDFSYDFIYGTNCTYAPTFTNNLTVYGQKHGYDYPSSSLYQQYQSTNILNVFMANGQLVSTPNVNATLGGAASYTNTDGSTTSSPSIPTDNGSNFTAYNASAVNPVIDTCSYSGGYAWVPRSVSIKITKPGYYWLTFSAQGDPLTGTGAGAGIDDVKVSALGSLYMSSPPSSPVTIPVPSPQPGASVPYNGLSITADPLTP